MFQKLLATLVEKLESRQLRSVTVEETYPGFFQLTAGPDDHTIAITVSNEDATMTVDNTTYENVSAFSLQTGDGDDHIEVTSIDGDGGITAAINAGAGNNYVSLNFSGSITTGDGNDEVYLSDSYRGEVYTNGGADTINVSAFSVEATVDAGSGNDVIDCSNNDGPVTVFGRAGGDTIYGSDYNDLLYGNDGDDFIYGHGGADAIYSGSGYDTIDGGGGNDTIVTDESWTADGGDGNDVVYAWDVDGINTNVEHVYQRV